MGRRGPKPTPTAVLAARGSWRAKARPHEPKGVVCVPECPDWVTKNKHADGRKMFVELATQLAALGIMTENDTLTLALLCDSWVRYIEAKNRIDKEGMLLKSKKDGGGVYAHPLMGVMNSSWERILKGCQHFGLSPASRAGLTTSGPQLRVVGGRRTDAEDSEHIGNILKIEPPTNFKLQ